MNDTNGKPPAGLHFLKALTHGAMAVAHIAFGSNDEQNQDEERPRRRKLRRPSQEGARSGISGACCKGRRK